MNGAFESHGHGPNTPVAESVVIRMGVEELRLLISEVVREAVGGMGMQGGRGLGAEVVGVEVGVEEGIGGADEPVAVAVFEGGKEEEGEDEVLAILNSTGEGVGRATDVESRDKGED